MSFKVVMLLMSLILPMFGKLFFTDFVDSLILATFGKRHGIDFVDVVNPGNVW